MSELKPFVVNDLTSLKGVGAATLSPDGSKLAYVVSEILEKENGYRSTIWLWEDGVSRQLTNGLNPVTRDSAPKWSPDGNWLAFSSARGGRNQVWLLAIAGGEAKQFTQAPRGIATFAWAPDSKSIYYLAKEETPQKSEREGSTVRHITKLRYKFNGAGYLDNFFSHIYVQQLGCCEAKQLTTGDCDAGEPFVSPDGKKILFITRRGPETVLDRDLWLLDIESGEQKNLTQGDTQVNSILWKKDSQHIIFIGHQKGRRPGAYPEIREMNITNGESRCIVPELPGFPAPLSGADVRFDGGNSGPLLSDCEKHLFFIGSEGGNSYLYRCELASGEVHKVYGEGQQVVTSFTLANGIVAFHLATPKTIGDLWLGSPRDKKEFTQITSINEALFAQRWFAWPEQIIFTHPDGCKLEGWIMKPYGYQEGQKYPLVMEIHGGPNSTYGNCFFHEFQVLAGMGIGVLYTNPRGSMGYGEDFSTVIIGDWCGIDARDLQFMAEEGAKLPWVDARKVGVTGGSQGGYFTNWLVGHTDMFAAAVTQRSMSNLYTKYGTADNGWNGDKFGMGGVDLWDNEELLMERSPIRYANRVKTPILFIHSDMDFRCPLEQAEQFYVAIKRNGTPAELVLFAGENHELSRSGKPANRLSRLDYLTGWFDKYLLNK